MTRRRCGEAGQALVLVLGLALIFCVGGVALATNVTQQEPIVEQDLIKHAAYRAMVAGLDEYLYAMNANSDYVTCNASNQGSGFCTNLTFSQWVPVATATVNSPPSWYIDSNPSVNTTTGAVSMSVVGAAGYNGQYQYQTGTLVLTPLNNFLLNVLWLNYDQIDPAVISPSHPPNCNYYWRSGLGSNCAAVNLVTGDTLSGNVYMNDSVFVCGNPSFINLTTADPNNYYVATCSSNPTFSGSKTKGAAVEAIPSDDSQLATVAAQGGCLYEGPTTITLTGATMSVTSPDTPTGPPLHGSAPANDALNLAANKNVCMPSSQGGSVALPSNGVVFVENCLSQNSSCTAHNAYNPMAGYDETGASGPTYGDAIVQGTVTGPLTIAAQNNVVIDGNICYSSTSSCSSAPTSPSTDILGLVAYNYVEINHPVTYSNNQYVNLPSCGAGQPAPPACDLSNPNIDAVILALNHSFLVNAYNQGAPLGTLTIEGTVDEDWRGPVGTSQSGSIVTGYSKNYQYDARLHYLSPPYYLSPGTSSWGLASINVNPGLTCYLPSTGTCPAVP
ncbi:MAG TPA: hypothetical protein VE991_11995 [Acidimicrobiales bacterium]|nr:hypothetical protein [Acidimicrobiales bacterium]